MRLVYVELCVLPSPRPWGSLYIVIARAVVSRLEALLAPTYLCQVTSYTSKLDKTILAPTNLRLARCDIFVKPVPVHCLRKLERIRRIFACG